MQAPSSVQVTSVCHQASNDQPPQCSHQTLSDTFLQAEEKARAQRGAERAAAVKAFRSEMSDRSSAAQEARRAAVGSPIVSSQWRMSPLRYVVAALARRPDAPSIGVALLGTTIGAAGRFDPSNPTWYFLWCPTRISRLTAAQCAQVRGVEKAHARLAREANKAADDMRARRMEALKVHSLLGLHRTAI